MQQVDLLLLENLAWSNDKQEDNPDYFSDSSKSQRPSFLWIGCSDSRVPAEEVTNSSPGTIFVHRNIANQVFNTDDNLMSVLEYAVVVLKVDHIIVCGHYGCGGVKAAMQTLPPMPHISNWLQELSYNYQQNIQHKHASVDEEFTHLVQLNVIKQVEKLTETSVIVNEQAQRGYPFIHGWVYQLETGLIEPIITLPKQKVT
jgi:carbonic anhydrase